MRLFYHFHLHRPYFLKFSLDSYILCAAVLFCCNFYLWIVVFFSVFIAYFCIWFFILLPFLFSSLLRFYKTTIWCHRDSVYMSQHWFQVPLCNKEETFGKLLERNVITTFRLSLIRISYFSKTCINLLNWPHGTTHGFDIDLCLTFKDLVS
jgi:hypothetical protein